MKMLYLAGLLSASLLLANCQKTTTVTTLAPVVTTAPAQTVTLPAESVVLTGKATSTGNALIAGYIWSQVAGPHTAAIAAPGHSTTTASGLRAGTYVFELFATDSKGATGTAFDTVRINAPWATATSPHLSAIY